MKFFLFITVVFLFNHAYASCTKGMITINSGVAQMCDGASWHDLGLSIQSSCTAAENGKIRDISNNPEICNGTNWLNVFGSQGNSCDISNAGKISWVDDYSKLQYCNGSYWHVPYIATAPTVSSVNINASAGTTNSNTISIDTGTSSSDSRSLMTEFCFKGTAGSTVPDTPDVDDLCWESVLDPSINLTPSTSLALNSYSFFIGFIESNYTVYVWTKNSAGQISTLTNSGLGTEGVDKKTIYYDPVDPPSLINILAANSNTADFPLDSTETTIATGNDVYIKWNASSTHFGASPISLYYTEDEENFTLIASGVSNSANTGCTVDGVVFTGCYRWVGGSPVSSYYRVKVVAEDTFGANSSSTSSGINMGTFNTLAGNTDPGVDGSAASAIISSYISTQYVDSKSMVVTSDGTFYIRDINYGIMKIDPVTGKYSVLMPYTGTIVDGPIGTATLKYPYARMTLDYDGNLIILDHTRIRKVDLSTNTVTSIVGGGSSTTSGDDALNFSLSCASTRAEYCKLIALPNGDIYFINRVAGTYTPSSGGKIWHYKKSDGKVYGITPSGTGFSGYPTNDISTSTLTGVVLEFDTSTSVINKFYATFRRVPCVGCGMSFGPAELDQTTWVSSGSGYPAPSSYGGHAQITAMNGKIYFVRLASIYEYDSTTNTTTKIMGSNSIGYCADGSAAATCDFHLQDAFVTASGDIYFLDKGQLRTIGTAGNVVTIFGQRKDFGDGGLATSARFADIESIDETSSGKIVVLDADEHAIKQFTVGGNIERLVGNYKTSGASDGALGITSSASGSWWGNRHNVIYDDSNEDIYFHSSGSIYRYQQSDKKIYQAFGHGSTPFSSGDGLVGADVSLGNYQDQLIAFTGSKIVAHSHYWNGSYAERGYVKMYDKNDSYRQSHLTGNNNATASTFPADGSSVATSAGRANAYQPYKRMYYDLSGDTFYFADGAKIRSMPVGGVFGTLVTLPRSISSFTMTQNTSSQWVVYYCSGGDVYKYNVTTSTETSLNIPSSTISCGGVTMHRSPSRNSIVFPYRQNGLWAVGEIIDTP